MGVPGCLFTHATRSWSGTRAGMEHQRGCPASCGVPADGLQVGSQIPGGGFRQGGKTARRDPTESPVGYPSASYARSSCCVGSAWGATGLLERCISRARRSTGFFAGLACSGSRVLNPYPIRTATSGLTPVICCSTWTPRSWAAWAPLVRYSGGRSEDLSGAWRDGTSKDLCAGRGPSGPDRAIPATASHPARCNAAGQRAISVAEADGNRTRRRAFARPPILKACPTVARPLGL